MAILFGLAACGGGGSGGSPAAGDGDPTPGGPTTPTDPGAPDPGTPDPGTPDPGTPDPGVPTKAWNGFLKSTAQGATVCLDENRNLACDEGEYATTVVPDGSYTLNVPEDAEPTESILVGQFAADSLYGAAAHNDMVPPAPFTLATPATETSQMGVVSTLAAIRLKDDPSLSPEQALANARSDLQLPADLAGVDPAEVERLETAALPALRQAANGIYLAAGSTDLGAATAAAGPALETVIGKFIDPSVLALQNLIGEKTLVSEAVSLAAPQACHAKPVEVMRIDVEDPTDFIFDETKPLNGKEPYRDATIRVDAGEAYPDGFEALIEIRGRGNTTWNHPDYIKKPFRLRLPKPGGEILGMPAARNWVLLSNHSDKSGLRNALAFCLGKQMNLRFAQPTEFVELYLNGEYQGVYQFTTHTEAHENRVDIGPLWPEEDEFTANAGYLLEMDARAPEEDEVWFESAGEEGNAFRPQRPYAIKSDTVDEPHDPATIDAQNAYRMAIKAEIDAMEAAFNHQDPEQRVAAAAPLVDMEEMVDFYLINELMRNSDAFWSSTYLHRPSNGKIMFGPLWDFDLSAGNDDSAENPSAIRWCPQGWFVRWVSSDYVEPMLLDPEFQELLLTRWAYMESRLPALWSYIDQASANMEEAQGRNFTIGKGDLTQTVWPNYTVFPTYGQEVDYLKQWLQARAAWIGDRIDSPDTGTPGCAAWAADPRWAPYIVAE